MEKKYLRMLGNFQIVLPQNADAHDPIFSKARDISVECWWLRSTAAVPVSNWGSWRKSGSCHWRTKDRTGIWQSLLHVEKNRAAPSRKRKLVEACDGHRLPLGRALKNSSSHANLEQGESDASSKRQTFACRFADTSLALCDLLQDLVE
jgi:hypothetical protein